MDVAHLIQSGGLALIALIIFAESGMFVGFFFPGDTLLLTAGVFAAQGKLPLLTTIIVIALAAIAGDNTGYHIGKRYGRKLFEHSGRWLNKEHLRRAEEFYSRNGNRTMLIAHFFPVVRTFVPPIAGVASMNYRLFVIFDAIGDTAWAAIVTLIGYWFGTKIPDLDRYILLAVGAVMIITLGPAIYHFAKAARKNRRS